MRDLCKVSKITKITPIPTKDRIELATIENFPVIVGKGDYKVGDLCIFQYYDTIAPANEKFKHLSKYCAYSKAYDGYRVRNMRMAGTYSSGITHSLDMVPAKYRKLDTDLTDILGIRRYDPEELKELSGEKSNFTLKRKIISKLMRYKWFRKIFSRFNTKVTKTYPLHVAKSSETNVEKCFNVLPKAHQYYRTEKLEGSAGTWLLLGKKNTFMQFSHNVYRDIKENCIWTTIAKELKLEDILQEEYKHNKVRLAIQGEVCGVGVRKNIYGFTNLRMFVYKVTNVDTGGALNYKELVAFCKKYDLTMVPLIDKGATSFLLERVSDMLEDCEGYSIFKNNGNKVKREGIVWRSTTDQNIGCKCKSRDYQAWWSKKEVTE